MYIFRTRLPALLSALLIASVLLFAGCDDDSLTPPPVEDDLFDRYVSLGNSITAGFQSSGISAATQRDAYPVLLAEQMGTPFNSPLLAGDGCPPPLTNAITGERAGSSPCGLRQNPPVRLNNVAVPGSAVADLLDNNAPRNNANTLTQLFLGGRTQVEAAAEANPTFVTIWTGNNDVLNAAFAGVVTPETVTSVSDFEARYKSALDTLEEAGAQGGVLYGVSDVTLIPHFSAGAAYAQAAQSGQLPTSFQVGNQCATTNVRVPFRYGGALLQTAQVQDGLLQLQNQLDALQEETGINIPSYVANEPTILQCGSPQPLGEVVAPIRSEVRSFKNEITSLIENLEAQLEDDSLPDNERAAIEGAVSALTEAQQAISEGDSALTSVLEEGADLSILAQDEVALVRSRVDAYNTFIQNEAEARDWVYQPINPTLNELRESGDILPFPNFSDPSGDFFGTAFSLDGIHPNSSTHERIANTTIEAINEEYGTSLSTLE